MIINWFTGRCKKENVDIQPYEIERQPYYKIPDQEGVEQRRLIDPEKLIEQRFEAWVTDSGDTFVELTDLMSALKQAPTEAVTGLAKWNGERGEFTCSHCGESAPLDGYLDARYCYGCGYLMKNSSKWEEEK